jgi:purine-nucleoside phosphorylase
MQGRFHAYEGYATAICTLPMRVFKLIGVETVALTCAAGGINEGYNVGDIMIIKDHLSLPVWTLQHPLVGENDERFGPRFPAVNHLYKKELRNIFKQVAKDLNITIEEGVYVSLGGPSYETVSEIKAFRLLGADAVGMSTAHEAIVAGHCGMSVFALALITNKAINDPDSDEQANHEEVVKIANQRAQDIENLVINFVQKI